MLWYDWLGIGGTIFLACATEQVVFVGLAPSTALMNMVGVSATMITLFYVGYKIGKETPHDN